MRKIMGGGSYNRQIRKNPNNSKSAIIWTILFSVIGVVLIGYAVIFWQDSIRAKYTVVGKTFINLPAVKGEDMGPEVIIYGKDSTSLQLREYENDGKLRNVLNVHYRINNDTVFIFSDGKPFSIYKIKWVDSEKYEAIVDSTKAETHVLAGSKYDKLNLK